MTRGLNYFLEEIAQTGESIDVRRGEVKEDAFFTLKYIFHSLSKRNLDRILSTRCFSNLRKHTAHITYTLTHTHVLPASVVIFAPFAQSIEKLTAFVE